MSKKKAAIVLGILAVAAAAAAGIWYYTQNIMRDSKDRVYVEKVSVIMGLTSGVQNRYSGVVEPQKTVDVETDSDRTVKEVFVKVGDDVAEGTPLFSYDTEELEMDLAQAKLELENQDLEISGFKSQITELEKEKNAAPDSGKFEYTTQIQTVQTQIKQAEFEKSSKQLEVDKIQKKIDNSQVVSTVAGVVKSLNNSDAQDMGDSSAFMTILSTGTYRIKATANEQNINKLTSGADVIVRSRVNEEITWKGTISGIDTDDPQSDSDEGAMDSSDSAGTVSSSSYPFFVELEDAESLMLGQHVIVELDEGQEDKKEGLWLFANYIVEEDAEGEDPEEMEDFSEDESEAGTDTEMLSEDMTEETWSQNTITYVWADDGNHRLEKRLVQLGEYDAGLDEFEIVSGLTEDDYIAWPIAGLYEGVVTVTDMDEVDYSSGLYNMGTEDMWNTEDMWFDTEGMYEEEMWFDTESMEPSEGEDNPGILRNFVDEDDLGGV